MYDDQTIQSILTAFLCLINTGKVYERYVFPLTLEQCVIYGRNSVQYNLHSGSLPNKCCTLHNIPVHFDNLLST